MPRTELETEFLADHKKLTRGFRDLIEAVETDDRLAINRLTTELDLVAGPHIEFEEHVLYPTVEAERGTDYGKTLRHEHQVARSALRCLLDHADKPLPSEDRAKVVQQLRIGFEHAVACGSLLSHLTVLDESSQTKMLDKLRSYREQKLRWTELSG
ncbi:MAG: hemerythrin domain-containing protein [Planctomycetaceae bacterium]